MCGARWDPLSPREAPPNPSTGAGLGAHLLFATNPSPSSDCPVGVGRGEFKQICQFPSGDLERLSEQRLFLRPWRWCPPQQKPARPF